MTDLKNRLKNRQKKGIEVWFWDGMREYKGTARRLDTGGVEAVYKIAGDGDRTVVPGPALMQGLEKHLVNRKVDMKVSGKGMEANLKGTIKSINKQPKDDRRVILIAIFDPPKEREAVIINRLAQTII